MTAVRPLVSEQAFGRPAEPLRRYVAGYSGYRQAGVRPASHRGLPSPYLTVIFTLDDAVTVAEHADPRQPAESYLSLVGGLHTRPALITHDGAQSGVQVALRPLGARAILGMPAGPLAGIDLHGADVLGTAAERIQARLRSAAGWRERFEVLDAELMARLVMAGPDPVSPEVGHAWRRLLMSGGTLPVASLAAETGWSERHLRDRFDAEIGIGPKAAARVIRFDRARRLVHRRAAGGEPLDLAAIAAATGYFDQAHLDREFRSLAGGAPTSWLAHESAGQEFRNIQAAEIAARTGWGYDN